MIPKIIHYCWFGGSNLPDSAIKCINSWKKYFPDYEIKEWNESNFDLNCCSYVREAAEAKKWAFVSDYARFWILYNFGGIYFDTDVEVINDMSNIVKNGSFMGCETIGKCNPGLGMGAVKKLEIYKEILDYYNSIHFSYNNGNIQTVVDYTTKILENHGWKDLGEITVIKNISIYPSEYFCPYDYSTGIWNITEKTVSIHHYTSSWHSWIDNIIMNIERCDKENKPYRYKIRRIVSFPFRVLNKFYKIGFYKTLNLIKIKFKG
ncbi:glycosyltransferase family 32 protein [Enterococcus cecorum]|uniref:glycosyltransferase family 32 protein n=1 Tax=Enterococcus cecorum TaxID=44008 RepID=UPI003F2562E6